MLQYKLLLVSSCKTTLDIIHLKIYIKRRPLEYQNIFLLLKTNI